MVVHTDLGGYITPLSLAIHGDAKQFVQTCVQTYLQKIWDLGEISTPLEFIDTKNKRRLQTDPNAKCNGDAFSLDEKSIKYFVLR